jgi:hypothetical protein
VVCSPPVFAIKTPSGDELIYETSFVVKRSWDAAALLVHGELSRADADWRGSSSLLTVLSMSRDAGKQVVQIPEVFRHFENARMHEAVVVEGGA